MRSGTSTVLLMFPHSPIHLCVQGEWWLSAASYILGCLSGSYARMIKHTFFIWKGIDILRSQIFGTAAKMRAAGIVLFNIRMYRVTYVAFPFIKCSFEERNYVLSNIIAIIAKITVPCIYYVFNKYLPRNYTVSSSFTNTLFYQNTGKKLFFY